MRYPNHIILDVSKLSNSHITSSWTDSYKSLITKTKHFNNTLHVISNIKVSQKSIISKSNSTVITSNYSNVAKIKIPTVSQNTKTNNLLWSLFDINFIKKEKMYTKLKYSRSPQYDIVSGGVAALFAGFIGFLISEKFGIELVDSGDFYTFFMYIVFLCFATRPFFKIISKKNTLYHFFSLKFVFEYLYTLTILLIKFITNTLCLNTAISNTIVLTISFFKTNEYFSTLTKSFGKFISFLKNFPSNK